MIPGALPSPITSNYPLGDPNESFDLYSGILAASDGATSVNVDGTVRWDWLPTPRITYAFSTDDPKTNAWDLGENIEASVPDGEPLVPGGTEITAAREAQSAGNLSVEGRLVPTVRGNTSDVRRVTFLLPNVPQVNGEWIRGFGHSWNGRWILEAGDWQFIIDERHDRVPVRSRLRRSGGYAFTHVGEFTRKDGAAMPEDEISNVFHLLRCVFSFAFGRAISPALASGYDSNEVLTWLDWRVFHIAPWQPASQIIDETGIADLKQLFSGFGSLWSDQFARDLLSNAVSYYLECNDMNPLHLAASAGQAGLELLAYERLVEEQQVFTSAQYKPRKAHENISALLASYGISDALPSGLANLCGAAGSVNPPCGTGPEIITRMRNGVIHPSRKKPKFNTSQWLEAWELVSSYLILSILGRVSFNGRYRDPVNPQRHSGAVTKVPWAP
ncbi:hypothetical protein [Streptomyces sp. NBC_01518]|uniref:hypothetical protein n=1 Tax=Streptomyces sp. NBC_01518 TaxID=2903891 RepID=UPI00386D8862